jgi:hypothetical protein
VVLTIWVIGQCRWTFSDEGTAGGVTPYESGTRGGSALEELTFGDRLYVGPLDGWGLVRWRAGDSPQAVAATRPRGEI